MPHSQERTVDSRQLVGYRLMATQLYDLRDELDKERNERAPAASPVRVDEDLRRAEAYYLAGQLLQTVADAWIADAVADDADHPKPVLALTLEQVELLYAPIPDIVARARQELISPDSTVSVGEPRLPIRLPRRVEATGRRPAGYLVGMRRAAEAADALVQTSIFTRQQLESSLQVDHGARDAQVLYAGIQTRRRAADDIVGALDHGNAIADDAWEQAEAYYWENVFVDGLRALQSLADPTLDTSRGAVTSPEQAEDASPAAISRKHGETSPVSALAASWGARTNASQPTSAGMPKGRDGARLQRALSYWWVPVLLGSILLPLGIGVFDWWDGASGGPQGWADQHQAAAMASNPTTAPLLFSANYAQLSSIADPTTEPTDGQTVQLKDGLLRITNQSTVAARAATYQFGVLAKDMVADVRAELVTGDAGSSWGVELRYPTDGGDAYAVLVNGRGQYSIQEGSPGSWTALQDWTLTSDLVSGLDRSNHITFAIMGESLVLDINGRQEATVYDSNGSAPNEGDVALIVSNANEVLGVQSVGVFGVGSGAGPQANAPTATIAPTLTAAPISTFAASPALTALQHAATLPVLYQADYTAASLAPTPTQEDTRYVAFKQTGGALHLSAVSSQYQGQYFYGVTAQDVVVTASIAMLGGASDGSYGIDARCKTSCGYAFLVDGQGYYWLAASENGSWVTIFTAPSSIIATTAYNHFHTLSMAVVGDHLAFSIDGQVVASITDDTTSAPGDVAVFSNSVGATIGVRSITIRRAP